MCMPIAHVSKVSSDQVLLQLQGLINKIAKATTKQRQSLDGPHGSVNASSQSRQSSSVFSSILQITWYQYGPQ